MATVEVHPETKIIREQRAQEFLDLAKAVADGAVVPQSEIDRVSNLAERRFEPMVASIKGRAACRERHANLDNVRARQAVLDAEARASLAELEEATQKHQRTIWQQQAERQQLQTEVSEASRLPAELARSCPCPLLASAHQSATFYVKQADAEEGQARDAQHRMQSMLTSARQRNSQSEVEHYTRAVERTTKGVAAAAQKKAEAVARMNAAWEAMANY